MPEKKEATRASKHPRRGAPAVDVFVDGQTRLGLLSYLVPAGWKLRPGDAVEVPFGTRTAHGMVVALRSDIGAATKPLGKLLGTRADPSDIQLALAVATHHFVEPSAVLKRLAPSGALETEPAKVGSVRVRGAHLPALPEKSSSRRILVRGPAHDGPSLAAAEAMRLSEHGQVLVLCPTVSAVSAVSDMFAAGAVRLDAGSGADEWVAFREGVAAVGIGTRTAALYSANHLAGIVVLDEDSGGHQEVSQPYTHARDLAVARSRSLGCELVLISATPSPQALRAVTSEVVLGTYGGWPRVTLADRSSDDPGASPLTPVMRSAIARADREGRKVLVVASSAPAVRRCSGCGSKRSCGSCEEEGCKHVPESACERCGSTKTRLSGWDVKRLSDLFGKKVDVTTLAKARESSKARTVILFDVDAYLYAPSLYPELPGAKALAKAAALAGAGGELVIGTIEPTNRLLRELATGKGFLPCSKRTLASAFQLDLPPAARLVTVKFSRKTAPDLSQWPGTVSGPRRTGEGEWEALVRIPAERLLELEPYVSKARKNSKARIRVE